MQSYYYTYPYTNSDFSGYKSLYSDQGYPVQSFGNFDSYVQSYTPSYNSSHYSNYIKGNDAYNSSTIDQYGNCVGSGCSNEYDAVYNISDSSRSWSTCADGSIGCSTYSQNLDSSGIGYDGANSVQIGVQDFTGDSSILNYTSGSDASCACYNCACDAENIGKALSSINNEKSDVLGVVSDAAQVDPILMTVIAVSAVTALATVVLACVCVKQGKQLENLMQNNMSGSTIKNDIIEEGPSTNLRDIAVENPILLENAVGA